MIKRSFETRERSHPRDDLRPVASTHVKTRRVALHAHETDGRWTDVDLSSSSFSSSFSYARFQSFPGETSKRSSARSLTLPRSQRSLLLHACGFQRNRFRARFSERIAAWPWGRLRLRDKPLSLRLVFLRAPLLSMTHRENWPTVARYYLDRRKRRRGWLSDLRSRSRGWMGINLRWYLLSMGREMFITTLPFIIV